MAALTQDLLPLSLLVLVVDENLLWNLDGYLFGWGGNFASILVIAAAAAAAAVVEED